MFFLGHLFPNKYDTLSPLPVSFYASYIHTYYTAEVTLYTQKSNIPRFTLSKMERGDTVKLVGARGAPPDQKTSKKTYIILYMQLKPQKNIRNAVLLLALRALSFMPDT